MVSQVSKLRQELAGEIVVYGSCRLVRMLMDHDLVDELALTVFPILVGAGERPFGETAAMKSLRLVAAQVVGQGLVFLNYHRVPAPSA